VNVAFHGVSKSLTIIKSPGTHDWNVDHAWLTYVGANLLN
jgi:hypothetical protein